MRKVSGHYELNKSAIKFDIEIPSAWNELDKHQFATIIQVLHFRKADPYTISVSLLALLFGQKNFHVLSGLPDELLTELVPLTNFLIEEKPPVQNYWPTINIKKKRHVAPADDLSNFSFGEWCFAFELYNYYRLTNDHHSLNKLIAVIYRPLDPNVKEGSSNYIGDLREKFNENLIEKRAQQVQGIEEKIKLAIVAWFSVALAEVIEDRPHVFPKKQGEQKAEESSGSDSRTWLTVFRELLGPKWGSIEMLKHTNAMFVLDELEDRQIEFEKAKRKK